MKQGKGNLLLQKNDLIPLTVESVGHEGNGVGRYEGMAVFVPGTAAGDAIRARVVKAAKTHAFAIVDELLEPSPDRVENDCPAYPKCGGCALRHLSYEAELRAKAGWVADNLRRIGGVDIALEPILPSPESGRYRNKAQYPVRLVDGRVRAGFFAPRSHRLIPAEDCLLQPESFRSIVAAVLALMEESGVPPYDEEAHTGVVRHIFIRRAETTGQVMVWLVVNADSLPRSEEWAARLRAACPELCSFGIDVNKRRTNVIFGGAPRTLWGADTITDTLRGVKLELSPLSFFQVNRAAAEELFGVALEYAAPAPGDLLLDLYCGAGAVGLSMAHAVREVIGVEAVPQAVEDARRNAALNGIGNARFLHADAGEAARRLLEEGLRPDIVVLDPPRKGAEEAVLDCIAALAPRRVVYISCDSATLARDVGRLAAHGYAVKRARPADLFPRTANVECCCLLERV